METKHEEENARFLRAAERMRTNSSLSLNNEQKLELYGYFKQATEGRCNIAKPGFFDFTGRAKWEAWQKLSDISKQEAVSKYVDLVTQIDPKWETEVHSETSSEPSSSGGGGGGGGGGGPVMSRFVDQEPDAVIPDRDKSVFDWCKEGQVERLRALLTVSNINNKDDQGMSLLHWACDRGHLGVVQLLVDQGADINVQDSDLQTPLHYASSCEQAALVSYLLSVGARVDLKDCDGLTPVEVASDENTQKLFAESS